MQEQLMLSILPKHIASEVREDIREEMQLRIGRKGKSTLTRKPFEQVSINPAVPKIKWIVIA